MSGQYRFQRLLPLDQESRQRNREAIVGQMLRCRNQVASSVAVKLSSTRTVVNSAWQNVDSTAVATRKEQSSMGTDRIEYKGNIRRATVARGSNTMKVECQYCITGWYEWPYLSAKHEVRQFHKYKSWTVEQIERRYMGGSFMMSKLEHLEFSCPLRQSPQFWH